MSLPAPPEPPPLPPAELAPTLRFPAVPGAAFRPDHVRPPVALALTVTILLSLGVALSGITIWTGIDTLALIARGDRGETVTIEEGEAIDLVAGLAGLAGMFVYIATIVVFCVWTHATVRNAHEVGMAKPSAGWAVGSYFVPFVQLAVPLMAMLEAAKWLARAAGRPARPGGLWPVGVWWGAWIAANVVGNIGLRLMLKDAFASAEPTLDQLKARAWANLAGEVLLVVAALACIGMVRFVTGLQRKALAKFASAPGAPPG